MDALRVKFTFCAFAFALMSCSYEEQSSQVIEEMPVNTISSANLNAIESELRYEFSLAFGALEKKITDCDADKHSAEAIIIDAENLSLIKEDIIKGLTYLQHRNFQDCFALERNRAGALLAQYVQFYEYNKNKLQSLDVNYNWDIINGSGSFSESSNDTVSPRDNLEFFFDPILTEGEYAFKLKYLTIDQAKREYLEEKVGTKQFDLRKTIEQLKGH